jgi:cytochrome P450
LFRSNGNPWKVAFWLITRILYTPSLRKDIEREIFPYINAEPKLSPNELAAKLESCTVLMATFHEVLRTTAGSKTARRIQDTCIIGNKRLEKGGQILIPHRQILLDKKIFGFDAEDFNANRFIQNPSLSKCQGFRPFGGGITYCPGRFLARKEILTVTGLLLGKFHVKVSDTTKRFPIMEQELPSLGIMGPKLGEDVNITVTV